jgi:hypothetical protein
MNDPEYGLTREEAIDRARLIALEEGWTWEEPVGARCYREGWFRNRRTYWEVWSNAGCRGCNVRVVIEADTGRICVMAFLPR